MRTANAMQLKARINAKAKQAGISPQHALQAYLLERLLCRVALSDYGDRVVIKGGVLIGSLLGIDKRTTMDLDTTLRGMELTHDSAREVFEAVAALDAGDDFAFEVVRTEDIREGADYQGVRVFLKAHYPPIDAPLSVDVTTGDAIVPGPVERGYPLMFGSGSIKLSSYPTVTVMAEKLEAVLSRGAATTRPRDFYDLHMLWHLRRDECAPAALAGALAATAGKRGTREAVEDWADTVADIEQSASMEAQWSRYAARFAYVGDLTLSEACATIREIMAEVSSARPEGQRP